MVFRAIFLAMCMSAVSHIWAAQFTAPATGVLTSHNQRVCLSWHILHNIMCHKQIQNGCVSLWWSVIGQYVWSTMCTNKRTPYNKTCPALPWQYLGASVSLRTISRRTGCGKTSHQQVPLPCKTKNLHLKSRVGANSPAPCLTSAMDRETRGFTCPMHLQQLASHTQIYIYIHVIIWGLLFRGGVLPAIL